MSNTEEKSQLRHRALVDPQVGGREAIHRILEAYGFHTRQALCEHLGVSQSTMGNRYARDTFPHDWIIACYLDTGASVEWLLTGHGSAFNSKQKGAPQPQLEHKIISNGVLISDDYLTFDSRFIPDDAKNTFCITYERKNYLVDEFEGDITDGVWLIEIDNLVSIRQIYRFPGGRIRVENGNASFECQVEDIRILGKVRSKTEYFE
ncbi:phage repressor protein [Ewingella americana]|nr:phage repressor protein [Ewingella americana]